ncbi:S-adenosyl-L-methionine-dependent methyltransferase [Echria macrotheca]|uniref:S-adenosyl-L-methionine-dependent methyltransferase n=1 Tax=Echria macrotheca TaxID=438768 RepID=A0AAJ0B594_9PEZI|nr:S-adenosyl-L-methionine-dependent methyltransferase [Echria macrotheca]
MSLYHETATILSAPTTHGGTLKSRVFSPPSSQKTPLRSPPSQIYALAVESTKWSAVLSEVINATDLLRLERKLTPILALLLTHDLLMTKAGVALPATHGLRQSVERHRARLSAELVRVRIRRGCATLEELRALVEETASQKNGGRQHPRWVRVNTLRTTVDEQLESTFKGYEVVATVAEVVDSSPTKKVLCLDGNVPNLLALPQGRTADITKSEAYKGGMLILQDKASCFPAVLLDPRPDGDEDLIDGCAAPGNKTTHAAAILEARGRGATQKVFAFEKDGHKRAATLRDMVRRAGCDDFTEVFGGTDFLRVDPDADRYARVGYLLLDPSCSGSGIVGRDELPELCLPRGPNEKTTPPTTKEKKGKKRKREDENDQNEGKKEMPVMVIDDDGETTILKSQADLRTRITALATFQTAVVTHAMRFPAARRITYSTCSVYAGENEHVVLRILQSDVARQRGWRILERKEQVTGMKEWPVRGDADACGGDLTVADACIRTYRDDGRGTMGFFVAGFVRDSDSDDEEREGSPFVRDAEGRIVRDENGIPTLRATGLKAVDLDKMEGEEEEEESGSEEYYVGPEGDEDDGDGDGPYVRDAEGRIVRDAMGMPTLKSAVRGRDPEGDKDGGEEWDGFDD